MSRGSDSFDFDEHKPMTLLRKLIVDVYLGGDKDSPSITTRLALLEEGMKRLDRFFWLGVATLLGVIANLFKSKLGL